MMKHKSLPWHVETLSAEKDSSSSIGVALLDEFHLATQYSEVAIILFHAGLQYINCPIKVPDCNSALFNKAVLLFLGVCGRSTTRWTGDTSLFSPRSWTPL